MSGVEIVLLCEDSQTNAFVRRFLRNRNFSNRDINTLPLPHGSQSGEQWVRERFPSELSAIRSRTSSYLIVITDADHYSTGERQQQLTAECGKQNIPVRTDDDPVLIFTPRRNIETWLSYLDGETIDEEKRYQKLPRERDCVRHAKELYRMCHEEQQLRQPAPPLLEEACTEYPKLQRK